MNPLRVTAAGRTVHAYTGWSAMPEPELTALRTTLKRYGKEHPALASELVALIDQETAKRDPGTASKTRP